MNAEQLAKAKKELAQIQKVIAKKLCELDGHDWRVLDVGSWVEYYKQAGSIISVLKPYLGFRGERATNPYHRTADFGDGRELWNEQPEFHAFQAGADAQYAQGWISLDSLEVSDDKAH